MLWLVENSGIKLMVNFLGRLFVLVYKLFYLVLRFFGFILLVFSSSVIVVFFFGWNIWGFNLVDGEEFVIFWFWDRLMFVGFRLL